MSEKVMIIGAGAREHTISEAYERSADVGEIVVAPGNDFVAHDREKSVTRDPNVSLQDVDSIVGAVLRHQPDLIDIAQDDAIASGAGDMLRSRGFDVFSPSQDAARLESDKQWSREFMVRHEIPTPEFRSFSQADRLDAVTYLRERYQRNRTAITFIKAAGLAAGKGALRADSFEEAVARIYQLSREFPTAAEHFVVEDGLEGEEYSYYAISDGRTFKTFKSAQDNKLSHDGDTGEQTGGMGSVSRTRLHPGVVEDIENLQIAPVVDGMVTEGHPYSGIIYLGGILTSDGVNTIEYNARWGDPEVQTVLPGVTSDYHELVRSAIAGELESTDLCEDDLVRVCVVGAAKGYPGSYAKGMEITGLGRAAEVPGVRIYGAAVAVREGKFYADGGRLFSVVGAGEYEDEARAKAHEAMQYIAIEGDALHYRTDI